MPRKVSTGRVGGPILGSLSTQNNTFSPVETNANIIFDPAGTGVVESATDLLVSGNNGVRLSDGDTNYALLKAPAGLSANYTLTFPVNGYKGDYINDISAELKADETNPEGCLFEDKAA